jgi:hypothetical protein
MQQALNLKERVFSTLQFIYIHWMLSNSYVCIVSEQKESLFFTCNYAMTITILYSYWEARKYLAPRPSYQSCFSAVKDML